MIDIRDFVDKVKQANPLASVIEDTGTEFHLAYHSGHIRGAEHDSLTVTEDKGLYNWFSRNEGGDVFSWVMARNPGMDFMAAVAHLAKRAGMEMPRWDGGPEGAALLEARKREEVFGVAQGVMAGWLRESKDAWDYVTMGPAANGEPRCYSPETVERAGLGFTGKGMPWSTWGMDAKQAMRSAFEAAGIDPHCPAAVAVAGFEGDVAEWAKRWGVEPSPEWVKKGYIGGMLAGKRLVYPHFHGGRVVYFSCRNILGSENGQDGRERKSYNLAEALAGKHVLYENALVTHSADHLAIVEGPGDAVALLEMGMAAVAILGADLVNFRDDLARLRRTTPGLPPEYRGQAGARGEGTPGVPPEYRGQAGAGRKIYLALDADQAGLDAVMGKKRDWPALEVLGPMAWMVNWEQLGCKDANAALAYIKTGRRRGQAGDALLAEEGLPEGWENLSLEEQARFAEERKRENAEKLHNLLETRVLHQVHPLIMDLAAWAGTVPGSGRADATKKTIEAAAQMAKDDFNLYRKELADLLNTGIRELENMVRDARTAGQVKRKDREAIPTWGGCIGGYLVDYLFDAERDEARLAWRTPDGRIETGDQVLIDGEWYEPAAPEDSLRNGAVIFPSDVGPNKGISELVSTVEMFLNSIYIMPSERTGRLIAYWVLMTYLYDSFETVIYLRAVGAAGSGKSEMMKRIGLLCYRTMTANGAASTASLFRSVEKFQGTVFLDEADIEQSGTENDMVKFYNLGAMRGQPIWRTQEVVIDGVREITTTSFQTFCPKLIAMRKDFKDDAIGSRSLTLKLVSREMTELRAADVPLAITPKMRQQAEVIRNMLLRWRLENWQKTISIDWEMYDMEISPRLNQVAGPLMAIAKDDPLQQEEIRKTLREYFQESMITNSMTLNARVLEALWKIWQYPDLRTKMVRVEPDGKAMIQIGSITEITNQLIDEMNMDEEADGEKSKHDKLKSRKVGQILREELNLQVSERRRDGYWVYWNEPRIVGLSTRYGVNREDFGPRSGEEPKATPTQQGLL